MRPVDMEAENICAKCHQAAKMSCGGCKGLPDGTGRSLVQVWYCTRQCQMDHWEQHKICCKEAKLRRSIYRAGTVARILALAFYTATWQSSIGAVIKQGSNWMIFPAKKLQGTSRLQPFPTQLIDNTETHAALLTYQSCSGSLVYLHEFLKLLFGSEYRMSTFNGRTDIP